jgi:hypothetical protein
LESARLAQQALYEDWQAHGTAVLQKVREDRPHEYLKVVASLLPKQLDVQATNDFEHLSDEELREEIVKSIVRMGIDPGELTEH